MSQQGLDNLEESFMQPGGELGGGEIASDPLTAKEIEVAAQDVQDNVYTVLRTEGKYLALEALDDQLILVEDKFRTGFECKTCDGDQHLGEKCTMCGGTGVETNSLSQDDKTAYPCRRCGSTSHKGFNPCAECKGTGGLLIAPDIAKRRPTTGVITSVGKKVKENGILKPGMRIMYALFAGSAIQFKQKICVRIMHEHEVMCILHGQMKIGDSVR